jgi:RHS repeat-associated protein
MTYTWGSDNKLRSADIDANGTVDVNFQYDALGRRVARTGTGGSVVYVQMDQQTIADYPVGGAATTPTFRYVYASYIDEPVVRKGPTSTSTVHFYHRNHQYSVTAITTSTGAIAERYAYTAYGQPTILNSSGTPLSPQTSTLNSRYSYTGREWDATLGLHHFRARWMSGSTGRFLTRDPIGFEGGQECLYGFVDGKSFLAREPSGLIDGNGGGEIFPPTPGQPLGPTQNPG